MEYNNVLINFCERKLNPHRPEYLNAFSALYISAIGYYFLITTKNLSTNIAIIYWCIFTNGIASFLYHWYALYIFKLFDEFTMIIPIWFGISKILFDYNYNIHYIGIFTIFNMLFLTFTVFPWFNAYFPVCFLTEFFILISLYYQSLKYNTDLKLKYNGLKGILICSSCSIIWAITELNCNKYLIFGHSIWHVGMSTGLCYKINYFHTILHDKNK